MCAAGQTDFRTADQEFIDKAFSLCFTNGYRHAL